MKKFLIAPLAALFFAFSANASPLKSLTLQQPQQTAEKGLHADLVEIQTHRSAVGVIATDALYGGLAGLAIGGGVALLQNDGNWGRDLAIGAGAGLIIGGVFGAVDAASVADRAYPVGALREIGFSRAVSPLGGKF